MADISVARLTPARMEMVRGAALNEMVNVMIAYDPNYPEGASAAEIANYTRRMRYHALRALRAEQAQQ
jgi:hypothetical protein